MKWSVSAREAFLVCYCLASLMTGSAVLALESPRSPSVELTLSPEKTALAGHAEAVCDPSGNMPLSRAESADYLPLPAVKPTTSDCSGYWVRFSAISATADANTWVLQLQNPWRHADLYFLSDGAVIAEHTGIAVPPQDRALASGNTALPLYLAGAAQKTFYLHLTGDTSRFGESRAVAANLMPLRGWLLAQRAVTFGQGIYAGVLLGLALYNLILFLAIQDRVYLYYVLYVLSFGTMWLSRSGFLYQYLWPTHPLWNDIYQPYFAASAILFSVLFVRKFLATSTRIPRVDRLLLGLALLTGLTCLAGLGGDGNRMALPLSVLGITVSILYAIIGMASLVQGYRPARFFLVAWAALLVGNVIYILMFLRVLPMTFVTYNAAQAGSALECVLLAFALADRVNLLKRAREARQIEYTHQLEVQVRQRTRELSAAVEKLEAASATDPLTGLSNRRHVETAIQPWIADIQRARIRNSPGEPRRYLAVCLADLDHFKVVNDALGHAAGDTVLQAAADALRQNVRATAILARWGGEEFLILDRVSEPQEDLHMAERLRLAIVNAIWPVGLAPSQKLSLSLGVVRYPFSDRYPDLLDWEHCLALADHALYRAKRAGRDRWQCYRANEGALVAAVRERGEEDVRRLLRLQAEEAFSLGLIEAVDRIQSGIPVS